MTFKPNPLCLRAVDFVPVETEERAGDGGGNGRTLEGYAAVFNTPTEINSFEGHFTEQIARGAFKKTIAERMPVLQFDHGHDARTGTVPIGKIQTLREDKKGLFVQADLFDNPVVEPIRQAIEGGAISGMSFRFKVTRDQWRDKQGNIVRNDELGQLLWEPGDRGPLQRTIREVQLFEAGPVVFPAYAETSVGVRSAAELTEEDRAALVAEYARTAVEADSEADERAMGMGDMPDGATAPKQNKKTPQKCPTCNQTMPKAYSADDEGTVEHSELPEAELRADESEGVEDGTLDEERSEGTGEAGAPEDAAPEGTSSGTNQGYDPSIRARKMRMRQIKNGKESPR